MTHGPCGPRQRQVYVLFACASDLHPPASGVTYTTRTPVREFPARGARQVAVTKSSIAQPCDRKETDRNRAVPVCVSSAGRVAACQERAQRIDTPAVP